MSSVPFDRKKFALMGSSHARDEVLTGVFYVTGPTGALWTNSGSPGVTGPFSSSIRTAGFSVVPWASPGVTGSGVTGTFVVATYKQFKAVRGASVMVGYGNATGGIPTATQGYKAEWAGNLGVTGGYLRFVNDSGVAVWPPSGTQLLLTLIMSQQGAD